MKPGQNSSPNYYSMGGMTDGTDDGVMRNRGGRAKRADGGTLFDRAFGTGGAEHLANPGMMASGDTLAAARKAHPENFMPLSQAGMPGAVENAAQKWPFEVYNGDPRITDMYQKYLNRPAEVGGGNAWADEIASKRMTPEQVAYQIGQSPEYKAGKNPYADFMRQPINQGTWYAPLLNRQRSLMNNQDNWNGLDLAQIRGAQQTAREQETGRRTNEAEQLALAAEAKAKADAEAKARNDAAEQERQKQMMLMMLMSRMWG